MKTVIQIKISLLVIITAIISQGSFAQNNEKQFNINGPSEQIITEQTGNNSGSIKPQNMINSPEGNSRITSPSDPEFHFELNPDPVPQYEGDINVSQVNSLNAWSNAVATVPPGAPNANRIWVASTEYKQGGPDTIKYYYSSNGGTSWVFYGKLYANIDGDYRADELDIEVVNSGSDVYIFGVASYNNFNNNQTEGVFFRFSTTNGGIYVLRLTNSNLGSNYNLYNFRITSDNTNFTSSTYLMITASCRVQCSGNSGNYGVYYMYVDQPFLIPGFNPQPIVTGTTGCPLTYSANYRIYSDVGYCRFAGLDKVFVMFHINAGSSYNSTIVSVYNNYNSLFNTLTINETVENYGQRMAFTGGNTANGIITYIRKFSGNDWDVACFRTPDGTSWTQSTIDQSSNRARWCDVIAVRGTTSDFKVGYIQDNPTSPSGFFTGNNSSTWNSPSSTVINNQQIDTIYTRVRAGYTGISGDNCLAVFANSSTFHAFASRLCQSTVGISNNENPVKFSLEQNYPNPFNPETNIKFTLSVSGKVSLRIFDVTGKLVSEIINRELQAGVHEVNFNAQDLSSGAYFYKLETNGFSDIKKMILIK